MIPGRIPRIRPRGLHRAGRHLGGCCPRLARRRVHPGSDAPHAHVRHRGLRRHAVQELLAAEYDIQLNKTSRNSILLQTNINNTRSDVAHLLNVLVEISHRRSSSGCRAAATRRARLRGAREVADDGRARSAQFQPLPRRASATTPRARRSKATCARRSSWRTTTTSCEHVKLNEPRHRPAAQERAAARFGATS